MIFDEKTHENDIQVQNQKWGKYLTPVNLIIHSEYVKVSTHNIHTQLHANRKRGKKGNKSQRLKEELQIMGKLGIGL